MKTKKLIKTVLLWVLGLVMVAVGVRHFTHPDFFMAIVPDYLPWPRELVYISGFFEVLGGIGVLIPKTRKAAAWGLVALYICVFPANIHQAIHQIPVGGKPVDSMLLWARLPLQIIPIAWAWWYTRPDDDEQDKVEEKAV